ncbi:MAG: prolyl-tRNA synthetase [Alphaproteobacteria bacterium]|jgi:prolyl-tRNA synthetase
MRVSRYFLPTLKEKPAEAQVISHRYMLRSGMIKQSASGIYTWLPLGLRVLKNIEAIIRQEHEKAGIVEMLMPTIQSADLWRQSGRFDAYGPEMLRFKDRNQRDMLYGPTNEEMITDVVRGSLRSYKQLPKILYHMQWKFRDEIRPRFGVMRGREFLMKDAYSFDISEQTAQNSYKKMMTVYLKTFSRMGLTAVPMRADTGPIGGKLSHEFLVLAPTGESEVFLDKACINNKISDFNLDYDNQESINKVYDHYTSHYAVTDEKYNQEDFFAKVDADNRLTGRGIEVGHIFMFGDKYSEPMEALFTSQEGKNIPLYMGSYGIGVSRLVATLIEASHDDKGIIWHKSVAPFHVGLVNLRQGLEATDSLCEEIYDKLEKAQITVLYHDTEERAGNKFSDMELIGLPYRIAIGPKGAERGIVEIKNRADDIVTELSIDDAVSFLQKQIFS